MTARLPHARDLLTRPANTVSASVSLPGVRRATTHKHVPRSAPDARLLPFHPDRKTSFNAEDSLHQAGGGVLPGMRAGEPG
jgi:hypothetical protein